METHTGILVLRSTPSESAIDTKKRLWVESGRELTEFTKDAFWDAFSHPHSKFIESHDKIYELTDHVEIEEDIDLFIENEDYSQIRFMSSFYNGGTCLEEVLEEGLTKKLNQKSDEVIKF